jgi:hypothetical protein
MRKIAILTFLIVFFLSFGCEKSNPDHSEDEPSEPDTELNDDENKPPAIY